MTEGTKKALKDGFDDLFEATKVTSTILSSTRGIIFGLGGRILFNFFQDFDETSRQLSTLSFDKFFTTITSVPYARTMLFRKWITAIIDLVVVAYLFVIGDSTREERIKRSPLEENIQTMIKHFYHS